MTGELCIVLIESDTLPPFW